jgi:hypothetical protein
VISSGYNFAVKDAARWGPSDAAHLARAFAKTERAMVQAGAIAHDLALTLRELQAGATGPGRDLAHSAPARCPCAARQTAIGQLHATRLGGVLLCGARVDRRRRVLNCRVDTETPAGAAEHARDAIGSPRERAATVPQPMQSATGCRATLRKEDS